MQVRIYANPKNVMQSGHAKTGRWLIQPVLPTARRPDQVIGWVSAKDTLSSLKLTFKTREEAEAFAAGQGWSALVDAPQERIVTPRNYVQNFKAWLTEKA